MRNLKSILRFGLGVSVFIVAFVGGVALRDEWRARSLERNSKHVTAGMSKEALVVLLGEPTCKKISDIPGSYWSYGSSTWDRWLDSENCGSILIEMSAGDKFVVKPPS